MMVAVVVTKTDEFNISGEKSEEASTGRGNEGVYDSNRNRTCSSAGLNNSHKNDTVENQEPNTDSSEDGNSDAKRKDSNAKSEDSDSE